MAKRSGLYVFFLFAFLTLIILLQFLSMIQTDRLYERISRFEKSIEGGMGAGGAIDRRGGVDGIHPAYTRHTSGIARDPNDGDWLVWCLGSEPSKLNPITSTDAMANDVLNFVFESFFEYDPDTLEQRPVLAESREVSADGLEITFKLKEDIHFSDGAPVTADDVIFSFNTIRDPNVDAASLANYFINFEGINKIDERTVRFKLKEKYFKAIELASGMLILPKHVYQYKTGKQFNDIRSNPVGSGPYVFETWDVGRKIVLSRNERYWGKRPRLGKMVFNIITNDVASMQSLRVGNVDYLETATEQYFELMKDKEFQKKYDLLKYWDYRGGYLYLGWNNERPYFTDLKMRLAMTHLVNREAIRDHIQKGLSTIISGPFYILGKQTDPNIKPWPYDPKTAAALLDEAGWRDTNGNGVRDKDGVEFKFRLMIPSGSPIIERVCKLLKDDARQTGIDISLEPFESSVFLERMMAQDFDAVLSGWQYASPEDDPYQIFHSSQAVKRGSNHVAFNIEEADRLMEEARVTLDEDKRNELYRRFAMVLHQEQPYTFLTTRPHLKVLDKRFKGVIIHKGGGLDEREWFVPRGMQKYR